MSRLTGTVAVLALTSPLGGGGEASAQFSPYAPYTGRPQINPAINIFRGGATPGQNFYGLIQPQLDFRAGIAGVQAQTQLNQALITGLQTGGVTALPGPV